jgi:hypothetical protein
MGKYNSAIITTEGINMFASAIGGGETVTFMTMQASSHAYPSTTDFMSLTSLQDVEATVNVNYAGVYNTNVVQVSARFDNDGVSTADLINTLGLFAKLGNGDPKLVAVVTAVTPDQMPVYDANNPSAFIYNLQCTVQNAGSMAVSVNPAGTVTVEQFNEEMATKLGRTDNAVSATKLVTSRSLTVDLGSTTAANFDGTSDASIGVSGKLPIENGGTGASTQSGARSALGVPPTNHAVANTTYGSGTSTNYGHVKLSDNYATIDANEDAAHGVAASQNAAANAYKTLQSQVDGLEPRVSSSEQALTVNLLNPSLIDWSDLGLTVVKNSNNTYTITGTYTGSERKILSLGTSDRANLENGKTYRLTGIPAGAENISIRIGNDRHMTDEGNGATGVVTFPINGGFKLYVDPGFSAPEGITIKPMITTNLSATYDDYVPYSGSSGNLNTDYKALSAKIGNVGNTDLQSQVNAATQSIAQNTTDIATNAAGIAAINTKLAQTSFRTITPLNNFTINQNYKCQETMFGANVNIAFTVPQLSSDGWITAASFESAFGNRYDEHFDAFTYDDNRKVAIGKRTGEVFTLGTPLEVSVRRASKADSQIDFALIRRLDKNKSGSDDRKKKPRR